MVEPSLESVFLDLTGRSMRDGRRHDGAGAMLGKEWRQLVRDPAGLAMLFVMPIAFRGLSVALQGLRVPDQGGAASCA